MGKADCDDDADGGGDNSNNDGNVDEDGFFENWCVDKVVSDKADDGDGQADSVAGDLAECNGSSKIEMAGRITG